MTDSRTIERLMREFVSVACECEVRDYLISKYAERIEQAMASTLGSEREKALEKLVRSLYADYYSEWPDRAEETYTERMKELGIEVVNE